jgi:scyllo-inositol 2-dehydrogenase (NADP+)
VVGHAEPLRVGLIGFGLAGAAFHAPLLVTTPGVRLAAVVTRDAARRAQAMREHPGIALVDDAATLLRRGRDEIDLAVVATPNRSHVALAMAALEAGVPVVVDKPLATSAADARRLHEEARRRGAWLTVFQNRRWDGDFLTIRRLLAEGALGAPLRLESRFERWRPAPKPGWRERGDPAEGGGILLDLGSHLVDQALLLFGPAARVFAEIDRRRPGVEVEDDVFVAIEHASGVRSHLHMSAVAAQPGPRFRLLGSEAAFVKHGLDVQEEALRAGRRPSAGWGEEPEAWWGRLGSGDATTPVRTERGDYRRFYEAVAASLHGGSPPPVNPADAIAALEVLEAARRAASERTVVAIDRVPDAT